MLGYRFKDANSDNSLPNIISIQKSNKSINSSLSKDDEVDFKLSGKGKLSLN